MGLDQLARIPFDAEGSAASLPRLAAVGAAPSAPQLRVLQTATTELAEAVTIERISAIVAVAAREGLDADMVLFGVIHEEGGRHLRAVHLRAAQGEAHRPPSAMPLDGDGVLAQVARSGRAAYVEQVTDTSTSALAVLPIPAGAAPLGVMVVSRLRQPFDEDEQAFLSVLAELCAHATERLSVLRAGHDSYLHVGRMEIDLEQLQITIDGRSVTLTPSEIRLLMFLAKEPGRPRTRREILRHIWHTEYVGEERACDVHVSNLRRKLEADPSRPELVVTVRGIGYALRVSPA